MHDSAHKAVVQQSFTRQAEVYAVTPTVMDPARIARLVEAIGPAPGSRVLDVACGPGFLALAFPQHCREVIGLDLTDAPLAIAEKKRQARGLANVRFQRGDADRLPFGDGEFDVVVCRFALHHVEDPGRVLREMARVCRPQGKVAVEDLVTSEHRARGDYQNQFERLRDPSHTRALAASELLGLFAAAGLEVERLYSSELVQNLERWLANSQTLPDRAAQVRVLIDRDAREDLSGTRPYFEDGQWFFHHPTLTVVARRLDGSLR
ncbi:MAG TPA: methyltransferase domain-containing protein [Terriglobales bacterium]|nr:methyltransferase domain-containing protein [Terriglobales bacterium]